MGHPVALSCSKWQQKLLRFQFLQSVKYQKYILGTIKQLTKVTPLDDNHRKTYSMAVACQKITPYSNNSQ